MGYKTVLILSQVAGYMLSKFIGIKVISELKPQKRILLIIGLILTAETALVFFGTTPFPYNFIFLFMNGLPLGMVYGIVFSFLEGRRFTETLAMGLNISVIVASGILKTIYIDLHRLFPDISEFWMPAFMGALFLPCFLVFTWMLAVVPPPNEQDIRQRSKRSPMSNEDKRNVFASYGIPLCCIILTYTMLTMLRDFRDNFAIEIWNEIDALWDSSVLAKTEMITAFAILLIISSLSLVKSNALSFWLIMGMVTCGVLMAGLSSYLFEQHVISGFSWILWLGIGTFLAYIPLQSVFFDRMIALFKIKANAGFMIYLCDSIGYLGSVALLLYKEFFSVDLSWHKVLQSVAIWQSGLGVLLLLCCIGSLIVKKKETGQ